MLDFSQRFDCLIEVQAIRDVDGDRDFIFKHVLLG